MKKNPELFKIKVKNHGPEDQALTSPQRGGFGRQRTHGRMEYWKNGILETKSE